jgi:hypothetical protein
VHKKSTHLDGVLEVVGGRLRHARAVHLLRHGDHHVFVRVDRGHVGVHVGHLRLAVAVGHHAKPVQVLRRHALVGGQQFDGVIAVLGAIGAADDLLETVADLVDGVGRGLGVGGVLKQVQKSGITHGAGRAGGDVAPKCQDLGLVG